MSFQDTIQYRLENLPDTNIRHTDSLATFGEDSAQVQTINGSIQETFINPITSGSAPIEIAPLLKAVSPYDWMTDVLLLLLVFMVILWFAMPNRRSFFQQVKQSFKSKSDIAAQKPGLLFTFFFYLNYLIVIVLFIVLGIETFFQPTLIDESPTYLITLTSLVFIGYNLYKFAFIAAAGFLFETKRLAVEQMRFYINIDNLTGFLVLPVLLLILSTQLTYIFYLGIFIILIANLIKWFQTIVIGKSISGFTLYHLIIYLCTLEIIPLLLLIKLFENMGV